MGGSTERPTVRRGSANSQTSRDDTTGLLAPGTRVRDYLIEERISSGGFGSVYRVKNVMLGRPGALKLLHSELAHQPDMVVRFEREARAVNLVRHPAIIDIFDYGCLADGRPYFVMELLE